MQVIIPKVYPAIYIPAVGWTIKYGSKVANIWKMINHMRNVEYMQVLFKVYVQGKSIKQASQEMKRSYNFVLEIHKKALAEFAIWALYELSEIKIYDRIISK